MRCTFPPIFTLIALFISSFTLLQAQNALNFDGVNDRVQTGFAGVLGSSNRTFEAWVKPDASASGNIAILDYGLNAVGSRNTFNVGGNNQLSFISGGVNANLSSAANAVTSGVWNHVAFVLDNGTGYLYVNGTQVATGNLTTVNTPSGNTNLRIGERVPGGSIPYVGEIDEVRVWNVARTAAEISGNMNSEFCTIPSTLVAYYKLNEGTASGSNSGSTTAPDVSANGNNGTLNNFSLSGATSNWVAGVNLTTSTTTASVSITGCDSLVSPSGNYTWYVAGTYQDTIPTAAGCDSAMTITLILESSTSSSISVSACESYTSPSGNHTWTTSGSFSDTVQNAMGCDSIITIDLSINSSESTISVSACDSYTSPSGNYTWSVNGAYYDTILNAAGCDSMITILLTIVGSTVSSTINESACKSYTSPSGVYNWTSSGTYSDTLSTTEGCDSILTINLTINVADVSVTKDGQLLEANANGALYQWIDCAGNTAISGETSKVFQPTLSGSYAVVVTENGCTDTSECMTVQVVGIGSNPNSSLIAVYPNPTANWVNIQLGQLHNSIIVQVMDLRGRIVQQSEYKSIKLIREELNLKAGMYTLHIMTENDQQAVRILKLESQ